MSETTVTPKRQPSVLLIVSLCLNLALIGLIAITVMRTGLHRFEPREPKLNLNAQSLMRMVPAEQAKIQTIIDTHRKQMRSLRRQAMEAREESFRLLEAKDFSADDFAKSLASVDAADAALEAETMAMTAQAVAALTPQERADIAAKVQKPDRAELRKLFRKH
ncbi:MAG TPA: periplasmic heavy metal sensor [Rhizomicrobium sp.]|nr:periplasmic heavy metal sensor [Rhizomicrobium sp.]